ncbi:MAG: thioredoxin [Bacteroidota bacterium]
MGAKSGQVITLNKREFKQKIFDYSFSKEWDYKGDMPAVIDFYADWCAPCKMIAPILNRLAEEYDGQVKFYKLNTEKDPAVAKIFGISSIPTLLFIATTGKPIMLKGAQSQLSLKKNIKKIISKSESKSTSGNSFLKSLFSSKGTS